MGEKMWLNVFIPVVGMLSIIGIVTYLFYRQKWNRKEKIAILTSISLTFISLVHGMWNAYTTDKTAKLLRNDHESILIGQSETKEMLSGIVAMIDSNYDQPIQNIVYGDEVPDDEITDWIVKNRTDVIYKDDIFFVDMKVRKYGDKEWQRAVVADVGDIVEFQAEYINRQEDTASDVMIRSVLPTNMEYIESSTVLYNSNYQEGFEIPENTITTKGLNIGSYNYQGNAYVRFRTKVTNNNLANGLNQLQTWITVTQNKEALYYYANVFVNQ